MTDLLSPQLQNGSIGTPVPSKNIVEALLLKVGLKKHSVLSSAQMDERLLRENAWKLNADLAYEIIINGSSGWSNNGLLSALDNVATQAKRYRSRRAKLRGWVRQRIERELLVTLQAMTSINQIGYDNICPAERRVWTELLGSSTSKMHCWLTPDMRMDGGLFLFPGRPESALRIAVMPELFREPVRPAALAPQLDLEVMNDALTEWRATLEAWERDKTGITAASTRTRGDYLIHQVEASIAAMAASPKLQQSQKARDRLKESMAKIQEVLLDALKDAPADSEDAFIRHLDILDRQIF
jgi:hypothetical protein